MIFDHAGCQFDPKAAALQGRQDRQLPLDAEQAVALDKGFAGPKDSKGRQVYPGFPFDTGIAVDAGHSRSAARAARNPVGPPFTATTMDVDARAAGRGRRAADAAHGDVDAGRNLNTFSSHGGKLIFFHGVSDPWFSALDTVDYYERMTKANGGASQVTDWSRLFLVPGMGHCGGGPATLDNFDLLGAVVDWVEKRSPRRRSAPRAGASRDAAGRSAPTRSTRTTRRRATWRTPRPSSAVSRKSGPFGAFNSLRNR